MGMKEAMLGEVADRPLRRTALVRRLRRRHPLARWKGLAPWIDQEIANLKECQRLGFSATQATTETTLGQLDGYVDAPVKKSGYLEVADRAKDPAFTAQWTQVVEGSVLPALKRYRDFLRSEYLPRARPKASIESHPCSLNCPTTS